jgi:hypothetical protein
MLPIAITLSEAIKQAVTIGAKLGVRSIQPVSIAVGSTHRQISERVTDFIRKGRTDCEHKL